MNMQRKFVNHDFKLKAWFIVLLLSISISQSILAQQKPQFTQYRFNQLILNPAYAGADEALSVSLSNRSQWTNIEGAPVTQTLSGHTLFKNEHIGLGLTLLNDKIGIHRHTSFMSQIAYHMNTNSHTRISLGLQAEMHHQRSIYDQLLGSSQDVKWINQSTSNLFFNLGTGIYIRSRQTEAGLSLQDLIPGKFFQSDTLSIYRTRPTWLLFSKYRYALNSRINMEPSILLKYLQRTSFSFDLTACFVFYNAFTTGLCYRKSESIGALLRFQITPQLQLGYSYDHIIGVFSALGNRSHELMIHYLFKFQETNIVSPR